MSSTQVNLPVALLYQITTDYVVVNNRNLFLTVLEAGESKIKTPADSVSGFLVHRLLYFLCVLTWQKGEGSLWGLFYEALISFMKAPP